MLLLVGIKLWDPWLITESVIIFLLLIINVIVNIVNLYLTEIEMLRRLENVLNKLKNHAKNGVCWSEDNYPHLHTPLSASVVLQWTIRDDHKVNLPWALLVKNDSIYLKPGQVAPGRCHSADDPSLVVNKGEILHLLPDHPGDNVSPIPEFKPPVQPQLFVLEETPYISTVEYVLNRHQLDRPTSRYVCIDFHLMSPP